MSETEDNSYEAHERRKRALTERLRACQQDEIVGVVDPSGGGVVRVRSGDETEWTLVACLCPWRIAGQAMKESKLHLELKADAATLDETQNALKVHDVVRLRAQIIEDASGQRADGLLKVVIGTETRDEELSAQALARQKPVTFTDDLLGEFTLNRSVGWFGGKPLWMGKRIRLSLSVDTSVNADAFLKTAHLIWSAQKEWDQRARAVAVRDLLKLKNSAWLDTDEGETELSAAQFSAKIECESVNISDDEDITFYYNDGDLFLGHSIQISATISDGPTDAQIVG